MNVILQRELTSAASVVIIALPVVCTHLAERFSRTEVLKPLFPPLSTRMKRIYLVGGVPFYVLGAGQILLNFGATLWDAYRLFQP